MPGKPCARDGPGRKPCVLCGGGRRFALPSRGPRAVMWIAILFLGLAFFVGHALYFSARLKRAVALVLPRTRRWLGPLRAAYQIGRASCRERV